MAALMALPAASEKLGDPIAVLLRAVREHVGMDLAFIGEFVEGRRVFRFVDGTGNLLPIAAGGSDPLEETYCQAVVDGRLPGLMQNAMAVPLAASYKFTEVFPVGAFLSVPIRLYDGSLFGTYCCLSQTANPALSERDLQMLRVFADVTATHIDKIVEAGRSKERRASVLREFLAPEPSWMAYQPIVDLRTDRIVGVESLSRFPAPPVRPADQWFVEAAEAGLGDAFEAASVRRALGALARLPLGIALNVNVSPGLILSGEITAVLADQPLERLVLEVTEHQPIDDYETFEQVIGPLRARGLRIAVDDAGAGYATLRHVLRLKPDIIKLDISLIKMIDLDVGHRAMAAALIRFAAEMGAEIVAEGVETPAQLACLRELGAHTAQGYLMGRAMGLDEVVALMG